MLKKSSFSLIRLSCLFFLCLLSTYSFSTDKYNIIPCPATLLPQTGEFIFKPNTRILCNLKQTEDVELAHQFADQFQLVSGIRLKISELTPADTTNSIVLERSMDNSAEGYKLEISPAVILIKATTANGFFYGLQSLYQLMPAEIYGKKKKWFGKWSAPSVLIVDTPRFSYRGLHLDVGRHYFPVSFIKKYIDAMAIHKMNYFHWHLTEDQGWRIEIKKYPRLTEIGSQRSKTIEGYYFSRYPQQYDAKPYGGFYTQNEAREVVEYASKRFITVIPEIEMPGHALAALASYPYLACRKDSIFKVATRWGIFPDVYCPRDSTFRFLEDVLTEIMSIFPSKYIHIGGDECPKDRWKACPDCQARIQKEGLKDENGLQSYFIHRIETFLNSKGRQIIGWDEILDGGLAPNATVMSWRGTSGGISAAKAAHNVIMTPSSSCYFNFYQADPTTEPLAFGGFLTLNAVYEYEPVPSELNKDQAHYVLGAQANLWSEYIKTTEQAEYMAFLRVSAMSEVLWSSKENRNWDSFKNRMNKQFDRYKNIDINPSRVFYDVRFTSVPTPNHHIIITLLCDCPNAQIQYELGGKTYNYSKPFELTETSTLKASALINGQKLGKSICKKFIVSKLTGLSYTSSVNNTWYLGGAPNALTDGVPGNTTTYTQWVGIGKGKDAEISIDLKDSVLISRFSAGLLQAPALCVVYPSVIKLYGSSDGLNYNLLTERQIKENASPYWTSITTELNFTATRVRFLKLQLQSGGSCPSDCPDFHEGSKIFIDEISAW